MTFEAALAPTILAQPRAPDAREGGDGTSRHEPEHRRRGSVVETLTEYDEAHYVVYLRLLDARTDGPTPTEMVGCARDRSRTQRPDRAEKPSPAI